MIYLDPGDKVWYPYNTMVVQATVRECDDIYTGIGDKTIWHYRYLNDEVVSFPTDQKDESGWTIYTHPDPSVLKDYQRVNQLLWMDEPVGHGIILGDECFLTLQEALNTVVPSNKKHLKASSETISW